jgi:SAM-dependent methyltransferase
MAALTRDQLVGDLFRSAKRVIPKPILPVLAIAVDAATNFAETILSGPNPLIAPLRIRLHVGPFLNARLYRLSAERNLTALKELGDINPTSHVLDIGCGSGRMATALTGFLDKSGRYDGFDAAKEPVEWCQEHISLRFSNFRFRCTNTVSSRYNPAGTVHPVDFTFPYESNRFDLALAMSVYTHMLPEEVANFIAETVRVLRPGGISFATFCLLNETTLPLVAAGASSPVLPHAFGECKVRDLADPSSFIAHPETAIRHLYSRAQFRIIEPIGYGSWARPGEHSEMSSRYGFNQDIVLGMKSGLVVRD